jgi:uncharacterized protein
MFDPTFLAVAILAVMVVALSKSGLLGSLGFVGVPLLTLVMPAREAAGMMLPVLIAMDIVGMLSYRREADAANLKVLLPGAMLGICVGWALSSIVTESMVLLAVGVITLVFVLDAVLPLRKKLEGHPPSRPWGTFWGSIAGFTSFVSHTGGPPFQVYVLPQRLRPTLYAGTSVWFFAVVNAVKLIPYFFLGQLTVGSLEKSLLLVPVGILGMAVGVFLVRRISVRMFYGIAYVLVTILALKLAHDGFIGVFWS